jgi:hypothetical protein
MQRLKAMTIKQCLLADKPEYEMSKADVHLYELYYKFSLNTF